jgi:hypothetical protein
MASLNVITISPLRETPVPAGVTPVTAGGVVSSAKATVGNIPAVIHRHNSRLKIRFLIMDDLLLKR